MWLISKSITSLLTVEAYLPVAEQQHHSDAAAALMPPLGSSKWLVHNSSTEAFEPSSIQIACPVCQSIMITEIADESLAVCNGAYLLETYKRSGTGSIIQWSHVSRPCTFLYDTAMLKWCIRLDAHSATADDDAETCTDDAHIEREIEMIQPNIHCTAASRSTDITFTYNSSSTDSTLYSEQNGVVVSAAQDIVHINLAYSKDIIANDIHRAKVTVDFASATYISELNDVYSANARVTIHMDNVQGSHYVEMQLEDSNSNTIPTGSMWLHMFDAAKHIIVPRASARETSILELQRLSSQAQHAAPMKVLYLEKSATALLPLVIQANVTHYIQCMQLTINSIPAAHRTSNYAMQLWMRKLFNMQSITLQRMTGKATHHLSVVKGEECTGSITDVFNIAFFKLT
eukprot:7132-Heterococcus_DN1.PRE.5